MKSIIGILFFFSVVIFAYVLISQEQVRVILQEYLFWLHMKMEGSYVLFYGLYILFFIIAGFLTLPITSALTVAAGYFFGFWFGLLCAFMGTVIGSTLSFLCTRELIRHPIQVRYAQQLARFNMHIKKEGYRYLLALHLLPFTPNIMINSFAAMAPISPFTFVWTLSVGVFPGLIMHVLFGKQLYQLNNGHEFFSVTMIIVLVMVALCLIFLPVIKELINSWRGHASS